MKNRLFAALLAWIWGSFGLNEYYLGNIRLGLIETVVSILFCWTVFVPCVLHVINIIKGVMYLWCMDDEEMMVKFGPRQD